MHPDLSQKNQERLVAWAKKVIALYVQDSAYDGPFISIASVSSMPDYVVVTQARSIYRHLKPQVPLPP